MTKYLLPFLLFVSVGLSQGKKIDFTPTLKDTKTFRVSFDKSYIMTTKGGKTEVEEKKGGGFGGDFIYTILKDGSALFIAPPPAPGVAGATAKVSLVKAHDGSAMSFLEVVGGGYVQQLTILNDWNKGKGGFRCIYKRTAKIWTPIPINGVDRIELVSTYYGIAKPND